MTEKLDIRFNTGRSYSEDGQIIYATWKQGGYVKFADVTRGCYGRFNPNEDHMSEEALRLAVQSNYDSGRYELVAAAYNYYNECNKKENE